MTNTKTMTNQRQYQMEILSLKSVSKIQYIYNFAMCTIIHKHTQQMVRVRESQFLYVLCCFHLTHKPKSWILGFEHLKFFLAVHPFSVCREGGWKNNCSWKIQINHPKFSGMTADASETLLQIRVGVRCKEHSFCI